MEVERQLIIGVSLSLFRTCNCGFLIFRTSVPSPAPDITRVDVAFSYSLEDGMHQHSVNLPTNGVLYTMQLARKILRREVQASGQRHPENRILKTRTRT